MHQAWVVVVLIWYPQSRDDPIAIFLQLWRQLSIRLWHQNLRWSRQRIDLALLYPRWMRYRHAVKEIVAFGGEPEARPSTVAIADSADFLVFRPQGFGAGEDLGLPDIFAIAAHEVGYTNGPPLYRIRDSFREHFL